MHKKAFKNYKDFEFLKAGILSDEQKGKHRSEENKGRARVGDTYEPYNYPPIQSSVAAMLSNSNEVKVNIPGGAMARNGRRFEYSDQDFLESYLGKDYAASVRTDGE